MPVPNSTPIKFSAIREEGNKTSWVSPAYPNAGRQYNINPNWMIAVDENNQIGFAPDGSFSVGNEMPGWDTWKKPVFQFLKMQQYRAEYGVRLAMRVNAGDSVRAAYAIYRSQTRSDVVNAAGGALIAIIQYAGEYNPAAGLLTRYCRLSYIAGGGTNADRVVKGIKASYNWNDLAAHGDYNNTAPAAAAVFDPAAGTVNPDFLISFVDTGAGGSLAGETYYYAARAIDGRQFHTLGAARSDSVFSINNPVDISNYTKGSISLFTANALGDTPAANNGINVFSGYNGVTANPGVYDAFIEPVNLYYPYLSEASGDVWYAISTNTSAIEPPNGWTRGSGLPLHFESLNDSTSYKVWLAPYTEGDGGSPTADDETIVFTTDQAIPNAPHGLVFTSKNSPNPGDFGLDWCHQNNNGVAPTSYRVYYRNKELGGSWQQANTPDASRSYTVNIGFTNTDDNWEFYVVAIGPSGESGDSNYIETDLDSVQSGANC